MLGHLVSNAPRLIRPYMEPILKVSGATQSAMKLSSIYLPVPGSDSFSCNV